MAKLNQPTNQRDNGKSYTEALEILTPREIEILKLTEKGLTNRKISEMLHLSIKTVIILIQKNITRVILGSSFHILFNYSLMKKNYAILFFLVIFLVSCSQQIEIKDEPTVLFEDLQEDRKISYAFRDIQLNTPLQIMVLDSLLLIHDRFENNGESYFLSFVDRFTGDVIKYFGREGRGPDEFLFPSYITRVPGNKDVFGLNNRRLFSFSEISINNILGDSSSATVSKIDDLNTGYSMVGKINKQKLIGTGFFEDGRYAVSDTTGEMLYVGLDYPFEELFENMSTRELGMPFQSNLSFHPEKPILVSATVSASNLDIISSYDDTLSFESQIHTNYPLFENQSNSGRLSVQTLPENRAGYRDLDVTEQLIYTLYSGNRRSEGLSKYRSGNRILIYDWEGNAFKQLNLDKEAYRIAVSPDDQNLYTISLNENDEYYINVYELSL